VSDPSTLPIGSLDTLVVDRGTGAPVLLLHGSGPGVSAEANWRLTMPALIEAGHRVVAPDLIGFGRTVPPPDHVYDLRSWTDHVVAVMDATGLERTAVVGNSFGGALALRLAIEHPDRIDRLVLMGSVGVRFPLTPGLDTVWGYRAGAVGMRRVLETFVHDHAMITVDLARMRLAASMEDGADLRFAAMFPEPRQRWIDAMASDDDELRAITAPTLIVHGREDQVIPTSTSQTLFDLIPDAQLHLFARCGHWTQIEKAAEFNTLLTSFLGPPV
jgi:2-hydroxymuconate-semialdehyde hydrolase